MPSLLTYVNERNLTKEQCQRLWQKRHNARRAVSERLSYSKAHPVEEAALTNVEQAFHKDDTKENHSGK